MNDCIVFVGERFWANGDKYEGEFVKDKRNGYGTYHFANGRKYTGHYSDGK